MEAGADDNQRIYDFHKLPAKEAGHNAIISRPFRFFSTRAMVALIET
jgi:hypothetical protein